ncbi:HAMP domain-containing sensor histidine kinase [Gorillibacterium sp. CAU 1737]|uniref:sensor histidine kinase n=1 Tax=Gorillibacterium sp. CAU 1737 TaxID=3140362 RepID=UPI0032619CBE
MRFWQKAFLLTLALFLAAFDTGIFLTVQTTFRRNMDGERERSLNEHHFITASMARDLYAIEQRASENADRALESLFSGYAAYYREKGVYLELRKEGSPLYTDIPASSEELGVPKLQAKAGERTTVILAEDAGKLLFVHGTLAEPFGAYSLVYAHDISELLADQKRLNGLLIAITILISILLAGSLYLLLMRLLRPVRDLSQAAQRIAQGHIEERVGVVGHDEFAELAEHFNKMADQVQSHIRTLELAAEQKQQFVDNLAHELRTPLAAISGYADYLLRAAVDEEERYMATNYILSESRRLQQISLKLLDLALLRQNEVERVEVDLEKLFRQAEETLRPKLAEKRLTLLLTPQEQRVTSDPVLLESLLINLLDNACKACFPDGCIELSSYVDQGMTVLAVRDDGCGMTEEQLPRITEPFYRVDPSRSRKQGGAGLGLALSRQIAERLNALLDFASEPGAGTTVSIRFLQLPDKLVKSSQ